ncbi:MAG: TatD family hydrolase [Synergistales bacterium]|nr:TatD family hydrolase [Synergistales bacterium]
MPQPTFVDTHCHLTMPQFADDLADVLEGARERGIVRMLTVGTREESSSEAVRLAGECASHGVYAAVGVHPHEASTVSEGLPRSLRELAEAPRVVALGETGLDYYYDHSPREQQKRSFAEHIHWARAVGKPLVVHVRDAYDDALEIMRSEGADGIAGIVHCFTGQWEHARAALDLGWYISFAGVLTFKKSTTLRDVAARVPDDRILCETDAPFLAPEPRRGRRNEPALVRFVYSAAASARGSSVDEIARIVATNAEALFHWNTREDSP